VNDFTLSFEELDKAGRSISGVHSGRAQTHSWITPKFIIDALWRIVEATRGE